MNLKTYCYIIAALIYSALLTGCNSKNDFFSNSGSSINDSLGNTDTQLTFNLRDFYSNNTRLEFLTDSIYSSMTDDERAAQLIIPAVSDQVRFKFPFTKILALYKQHVIGGVLFLKNKKETVKIQTTQLRSLQDSLHLFPLIFTCDGEPALFNRKFIDADSIPSANEQKTIQDVIVATTEATQQIKDMNLNWNFAPVADLGFNQVIIGKRSFGTNPKDVINKSCTFIQTSNEFNIATSIKHFPGHGAITGDSHKGLVTINGPFEEIADFKKIIDSAKPVSVMVGHIAVNNATRFNTNEQPSSLSKIIVTGLLKDSLQFKGIAVTDAMIMGAVKNIPDADEKAINAGIDLVVMPQDPIKLHQYIKSLLSNKKNNATIENSIKKIIRLKICTQVINK